MYIVFIAHGYNMVKAPLGHFKPKIEEERFVDQLGAELLSEPQGLPNKIPRKSLCHGKIKKIEFVLSFDVGVSKTFVKLLNDFELLKTQGKSFLFKLLYKQMYYKLHSFWIIQLDLQH